MQFDELVTARNYPKAWEEEAAAGGVTLPADVMAGVANDELVQHSPPSTTSKTAGFLAAALLSACEWRPP